MRWRRLDIPGSDACELRPLADGWCVDGAATAWLDDSSWTFARHPQRYERRDARSYWYQSPTTGYEGMLVVNAEGFVQVYPGLWTAIDDEV